jgi:hypothetical protein
MMESQLEIKSVVVCDDVRREENGKDILIGVYSSGILVPQLPATLSLSFWIQFRARDAGEIAADFRLMGGEDVKFAEVHGRLQMAKPGIGSLALGPIPVALQVLRPLTLQFKQGDRDWTTIEEIPVEKGAPIVFPSGRPGAAAPATTAGS